MQSYYMLTKQQRSHEYLGNGMKVYHNVKGKLIKGPFYQELGTEGQRHPMEVDEAMLILAWYL